MSRKHTARGRSRRLASASAVLQPVEEEHAVGQTGQRIVEGGVRHLARQRQGRPHVTEHHHGPGDGAGGVVDGRRGILNRQIAAA